MLTLDGRGELVVQHAAAYERLLQLVDRAEAILGIQRGMEDFKAGRAVSVEQAGEKLRGFAVAERSSR